MKNDAPCCLCCGFERRSVSFTALALAPVFPPRLGLDDISFADAFRKVGARRLTLTLTLTLTLALTMQFNTTVMMSGYGCLAPYGRAQSGSTALCVWYSVRPVQTLTALRVAALCMPL